MLNFSIHRLEDALIDAFSHLQLTYEQCSTDLQNAVDHVKELVE